MRLPSAADSLATDLQSRGGVKQTPVLVLNLEVKDNAAEAAAAAPLALSLCRALEAAGDDWADAMERILSEFETAHARRPLYTICFY